MRRFEITYKGDIYRGSSPNVLKTILERNGMSKTEASNHVDKNIREFKPKLNKSIATTVSPKGHTLSEVLHGASAIVNVSYGNSVTQEEINRRAIICSSCPLLTDIKGCLGCGMGKKIINAVNALKKAFGFGFKIPNGLDKKYCGACGCALSVMLPARMSAFKELDQSKRPAHCWVKSTSTNYHES